MRQRIVFAVIGLLAFSSAYADRKPDVLPAPVDKVFIPTGFDDNDQIEIVLHGHFSDTCYAVKPAEYSIDKKNKVITINASAYHYQPFGATDNNCKVGDIPYTQAVNVGLQKEGKYAVIVRNEYGVLAEKKLTVKEATTDSPDDFVYAPVDSIVMERPDGVSPRIGLYGTYPLMLKGCMVIREIRHQVTEGDVVVIQPITAIATGKECDDQKLSREFYKSIVLNEVPLQPAREYLIHVRVLGNERHSLNKVAPLGL